MISAVHKFVHTPDQCAGSGFPRNQFKVTDVRLVRKPTAFIWEHGQDIRCSDDNILMQGCSLLRVKPVFLHSRGSSGQ